MHTESKKKVLTYALLDDQSNSSFISKELVNELGIGNSGKSTNLKLTTMFKSAIIKSKVMDGLSIMWVLTIIK